MRTTDSTHPAKKVNTNYREYLLERSRAGNYFLFFRPYLEIMSRDAALTIQSIINLGKTTDDGWIRCTVEYLEKDLKLKRDAQQRVLNELMGKDGVDKDGVDKDGMDKVVESRQFIEIKKMGVPPERYIWVDIEKIELEIQKVLENQSTGNPVERIEAITFNRVSRRLNNGKPGSSYIEGKDKSEKEEKVASPPPVAALPPDGSQRSSSPKTTKQKNSSKGRSTSPSVAALPRSEREDESPSKKGTVNSGSVAALPPLETTPLDKHTDKGLAPKSHLHTENASVGHIQDAADLYKCLRKALRENNIPPLDQSMKTGSAHLLELISKYGHSLEEVKETLEWYSRHCSRDDLKKYGLPTVQSCRQFAKHYEWIYNVKNSKKNRYSEETYDQW